MDFVSNPDLLTFRQNWPGTPREHGRFRAYGEPIDPSLAVVLRYLFTRNEQAREKRRDRFAPPSVRDDLQRPGDWVCWLGHASFLIQLDGRRYLTDPAWYSLSPLLPRRVARPYTPAELGRVDYVLISHDHRDHCDERTLRELAAALDFTVLTSLAMAPLIAPWMSRGQPVVEAGWYQRYRLPDAEPRVNFMPTQHWCRRYLTDTNRRLWGSFVLEGRERSVWFGGDSGYSPHFAEVAKYFPALDLAIVGIGAYEPQWMMQPSHTSPHEAWTGFEECGARQLFPMHYGTYDLSREPASEPIRELQACAKTAGRSADVIGGTVGEVVPF